MGRWWSGCKSKELTLLVICHENWLRWRHLSAQISQVGGFVQHPAGRVCILQSLQCYEYDARNETSLVHQGDKDKRLEQNMINTRRRMCWAACSPLMVQVDSTC